VSAARGMPTKQAGRPGARAWAGAGAGRKGPPADGFKVVGVNRRARFEYHIEETYEAGLALAGSEVKSLRAGRVSLQDSFARVENGEVILHDLHIAIYDQAHQFNHEPKRPRRLLLNRREIGRLAGRANQAGYTLVPLRVYFKGSWAKVELAVARGKRLYDKRQAIMERDAQRQMDRALRGRDPDQRRRRGGGGGGGGAGKP